MPRVAAVLFLSVLASAAFAFRTASGEVLKRSRGSCLARANF